jgi:hypothetical protein
MHKTTLVISAATSNEPRKNIARSEGPGDEIFVPTQDLRKLASRGIRGEFVFSIPTLLAKKPNLLKEELENLCRALIQRASEMLNEIGFERVTLELLDDLSLLTLGPQLRGSLNTRIGKIANRAVFEIIQQIVAHAIKSASESTLELSSPGTEEFADFRDRLVSLVGIASQPS